MLSKIAFKSISKSNLSSNKNFKKTFKYILNNIGIITLSFSLVLSFGFSSFSPEIIAESATLQSLKAKKEEIAKSLESKISDLENANNRKGSLTDEIKKWQDEAKHATENQKQAENLIKEYQKQKVEIEAKISGITDEMKGIYRQLQKYEMVSPVQTILSSKSLGEAIGKMYSLSSLQKKAEELRTNLKAKTDDLNESIKDQEETKKKATEAESSAKSNLSTAQDLLNKTGGSQSEYEKIVAAEKAEYQKIEAQIAAAESKAKASQSGGGNTGGGNNNGGGNTGGGNVPNPGNYCWYEETQDLGVSKGYFINPVPGSGISREFGSCNHDAIDLTNASGTPIRATASGTIVYKGASGNGYGNNIIIKHTVPNGNVVYSLYAHMSGFSGVSGDVSQGQVIGYMGCTGVCGGTHVHFMLMSGRNYRGAGCRLGASKCYRPSRYTNF